MDRRMNPFCVLELNEDEENYQDIFNQIMEHLDLNEENYKNDPKYISLLDGLNKKKDFFENVVLFNLIIVLLKLSCLLIGLRTKVGEMPTAVTFLNIAPSKS